MKDNKKSKVAYRAAIYIDVEVKTNRELTELVKKAVELTEMINKMRLLGEQTECEFNKFEKLFDPILGQFNRPLCSHLDAKYSEEHEFQSKKKGGYLE